MENKISMEIEGLDISGIIIYLNMKGRMNGNSYIPHNR